jgi:hypothetical protein
MEIESSTPDCSKAEPDRVAELCKKIKSTKEKMEEETRTFIGATKKFSLEWIQREMNLNTSPRSENHSKNVEISKDRANEPLHPEDLPFRIQDIVEEQLNRDDYWIHRNEMLHADISRDYIEFKKEKTRKDLTSSIRMILGCVAELFADMKDENFEDKVWVKERGRRKYICILRFSDEMTASLDRYFTMLEELFVLEYGMNKQTENMTNNGKSKKPENRR